MTMISDVPMTNVDRLNVWRKRMKSGFHYFSLQSHISLRSSPIAWDWRVTDPQFHHGRLYRPDGVLPLRKHCPRCITPGILSGPP